MTPRRSRAWWLLALPAAGCVPTRATPQDASVEDATVSDDAPAPVDVPALDLPPVTDDVPVVSMDSPILPDDVPPAVDVPAIPEDRGPPPPACESTALVDLAVLPRDGGLLRYLGTTASAPRAPSLTANCVGADGMGEAVHQVVHRYVPSVNGRLRASLDDAATDAAFDTVLFAQRACFPVRPGEALLDCNDDVETTSAMRPRASAILTPRVLAGVPVYLVVAGLPRSEGDPLRPSGAYALTVTELPEVAVGMACDLTERTNTCVPGAGCIDAGAGSPPRCVSDGTPDARCRTDGTDECNVGLRCFMGFCRRTIAVGAVCGPDVTGVCPEESSCQWVDGANRCVRTGARGSDCRDDAPRCDDGLSCVHTRFGDNCRATVASGARCDPWGFRDACAAGFVCALSPLGGAGTCVTPGSVAGSPCMPGAATRCAAGLECRPSPDGENEVCVSTALPAGRCDPLDGTTICSMDTDCAPNTALTDGVCAAPGAAAGAACRGVAPRCDTGLSCSLESGGGRCLRTVATGAACDLRYYSTRCMGGGCAADSATTATCRAATAETEPNDSPAAGTSLAGAAAVVLAGSLSGADVRDCVRVTIPAGASLVAETFTGDERVCERSGGDPSLSVYAPSGAEIVREDDSPRRGLCTTLAPWTHPQASGLTAGTYALCVGRGESAVPSYRLVVSVLR
nr:hypothetical protein [Deltaproteobacteria bacterium]